jgi:hypothetical protein
VIAGETQLQFPEQQNYLDQLHGLISELDLTDVAHIEARFLSLAEQIQLIWDARRAARRLLEDGGR